MKMITKKQLAQLLQLTPRSIDRGVAAGDIPRGIKVGGAVRWPEGTVEEWIARLGDNPETRTSADRAPEGSR